MWAKCLFLSASVSPPTLQEVPTALTQWVFTVITLKESTQPKKGQVTAQGPRSTHRSAIDLLSWPL